MEDRVSFLMTLPLFSNVERSIVQEVAAKMNLRHYAQGKMLFFAQEPGETLYFIEKGLIKIFAISEDGKEKTISLLEEGDTFGEMALLDDQGRSANAQALRDSTLHALYKNDFLKILKAHPEISYRMLYIMVQRLRDADRQIVELAFRNARQRVALLLLRLARKYGEKEGNWTKFQLALNQEEIGHLTGCTRESVNRAFHLLCEKGALEIGRDWYHTKLELLEELIPSL